MTSNPVSTVASDAPAEAHPGLFLQVAARLIHQLDDSHFRDTPLRPPYVCVLLTISHHPGIRQGVCAESLGYDATTFGRYVDRLVRDGLVERNVPPEDRRAVCLTLTEAGERTAAECAPVVRKLNAEVRSRMGESELEMLSALLMRFLGAFDHPLPNLIEAQKVTAD